MAKKKSSLASKIVALVLVVLLVVIVLGTIFEIFIAPKGSKVEAQYDDNDKVSVTRIHEVKTAAQIEAGTLLAVYGYQNDSLLKEVEQVVNITYKEKDGDNTTTYRAYVIYFDSIKSANKARDGISEKVKKNDRVAMFRGKTLVFGDQKAVLKYYAVIF